MIDKTSDLPKLAPKTSRVKSKKDGKTKNVIKKKSVKEISSLLLDIPMSSLDDSTDETSAKITTHVGMSNQDDSFYNLLNSLRELESKKNQIIASRVPDLTTDLDAEIIQIKQGERSVKLLLKTYFDGFDKELVPYSRAILTRPVQTPHISISLQKKSDD